MKPLMLTHYIIFHFLAVARTPQPHCMNVNTVH